MIRQGQHPKLAAESVAQFDEAVRRFRETQRAPNPAESPKTRPEVEFFQNACLRGVLHHR